MNIISRGIRNGFRNSIRTASIVIILGLSMGLALAMLVANQAVGKKITNVQSALGNTVSVSPAGARGFEGGGELLTNEQISKLTALSNVTTVDTSLSDRLTAENTTLQSAVDAGSLGRRNANNSGQGFQQQAPPEQKSGRYGGSAPGSVTRTFIPPVTVVGTTNPSDLSSTAGGGTFSLQQGTLFGPHSSENVALLGKTLATKNNLSVGSTFTAYTQPVKVVGIFDAGNTFANNQVIMPIAALQVLSGQTNQVSLAVLSVDSILNVDAVTVAAKSALGDAADVTNGAERAKQTLEPLQNIQKISLYSLIGALGAGSVIILMTMIMIVRERRREIGVIKAIGSSNAGIMLQFMTEAVTLTMLAAVVGVVIGALASSPITNMLVSNASPSGTAGQGARGGGIMARQTLQNIHGTAGISVVFYGIAASLIIAMVGSAIASLAISKVRPADVMRTE